MGPSICLHLLVLVLGITSVQSAAIINTKTFCNESTGIYLRPGQEVTLNCTVQNTNLGMVNNFLRWVTTTASLTIASNQVTSSGGTFPKFTANLISFNNGPGLETVSADLSFVANETQYREKIICQNAQLIQDTCTLLVCTRPSNTTNLVNTGKTFQSVSLSWNAPSDIGGCDDTVNYVITVNNGSHPWIFTTTDNNTSYIVTGLMFGQTYDFTVTANNSIGLGEESNMITVQVPGEVVPLFEDINVCIRRNLITSINNLIVNWTCPIPITNTSTTPPIINYAATDGNSTICAMTECSPINCTKSIVNGSLYDINVTFTNIVGESENIVGSGVVDFGLLNATVTNVSNSSVTLLCTTTYNMFASKCKIVLKSLNTMESKSEPFQSYFIDITFTDLTPGMPYTYTASLVDNSDATIPDACIMFIDTFNTTGEAPTPSSTISSSPTTSSFVQSSTTSIPGPTETPGGNGGGDGNRGTSGAVSSIVIIGSVMGIVLLLVIIIIIIIVVIAIRWFVSKKRTSKDLEPIPLVSKSHPAPETGQALYQDPNTIERQAAPTGELYAQPDKGRGSRRQPPTTPSAENATYQDPITIERQAAPTGELYAQPEKKPKYSEVQKQNTNVVYTDVDVIKGNSGQPRGKVAEVVYSDLK